ncbi:MAG: bifunctional oligoribonuclease/PAP phosphatase NrnA, partial [bacterium]
MSDILPRLKKVLEGCDFLYIFTHDHPDPDCIASSMVLKYIVKEKFGLDSMIVFGGDIRRAENLSMKTLLKVDLCNLNDLDQTRIKYAAIVDSQPSFGNNSFPEDLVPLIVIDHHSQDGIVGDIPFIDIRTGYGVTVSILFEYLCESGLPISGEMATAIYYGIFSETQCLGRDVGKPEIKAHTTLYPIVDFYTLSKIINPPLKTEYFRELSKTLKNAFTCGKLIGAYLGKVSYPEVVAQMADIIVKNENRMWAVCGGIHQNKLLLSIRTDEKKSQAGKLLYDLVTRFGKGDAGGHDMIAGGHLLLEDKVE